MIPSPDLFPRQVTVQRIITVATPADAAWAVVGQLDSKVLEGDLVERVEIDGSGEGAIRTYHLAGGGRVIERIERYNNADRLYIYRILDVGPLPMVRYLGLAQVTPAGPNRCHIGWHVMADPIDGDTAVLTAMLEATVGQALQAFANHLAPDNAGE
ncbi:MAG TPA: SRPBCC family protein [Sphingomicrobium sp.]|nr:SRPBCC family protein [Sphingomicrobium sp.]